MKKKGKSQKILGAIAFASTALFMFESRKNKENTKIEGLNIDIDPEKMIDNIKSYISPNEKVNEMVANFAKDKISKILAG
jgi:hypothetical protein